MEIATFKNSEDKRNNNYYPRQSRERMKQIISWIMLNMHAAIYKQTLMKHLVTNHSYKMVKGRTFTAESHECECSEAEN